MINTIILFTLLLVTWILPVSIEIRRSVHMMQLHSYENNRYREWMKENKQSISTPAELLYFIPLIVVAFADSANVQLLAATATFAVIFIIYLAVRRKEETPLEYTPRVQRLFGTTYVVYWIAASFAIFFGANVSIELAILLLVVFASIPFTVVKITNKINQPIEKRVIAGTGNDAKRLIKASPELKVIGIAENEGTADVKHWMKTILSAEYNVLATADNESADDTARTINKQLKPEHDIFIAGMSTEQKDGIRDIFGRFVIVPAAGEENTQPADQKTKEGIVELLPETGTVFLNKDEENKTVSDKQNAARLVYYGMEREDVDLSAADIRSDADGMTFTVKQKDGTEAEFYTSLTGRHHVYHILAAAAVGLELGMTLAQITEALKNKEPLKQ
ncbi:Mur ligase family protein [Alkalicoccus halolimnae]|uniref:Mur ligase family protein n=1 Tax=Alkalicoccus halolimnae TaxID=1667239 RepID=A0AAJ8N030_9BACI|nr:Mur ligase family protein [Alkalicoccus halolimnae]